MRKQRVVNKRNSFINRLSHVNSQKVLAGILVVVVLAILFLRYQKIFIWSILAFGASIIKYYRCRYWGHIPIVFEPVLFVGVVLTKGYGFMWSLAFLFGPNLFGELLSGGVQFALILSFLQFTFYQFIVLLLGNMNIVIVGLIICLLDIIIGHMMNTFVWGTPPFFLIYPISNLVTHFIYFSIFGDALVALLKATA
ncbi:hypothetical protein GF327_05995 [Candidatus Woesearchaeota archaeon]|nr:hypothetical protein [Candidatus Woesearchaeota archaeon]